MFVPIPRYLDQKIAIEKNYPPNLKVRQVKTTQKLSFPSQSRIEFGSE